VNLRLDEVGELDKNKKHRIDIVIDRVVLKDDVRSRLFDAIELALDWGHGYVTVLINDAERLFSQHHSCKYCGFSVPKLEPRLFSFNAPLGYCPDCNGLGFKREADPDLLVPNPNLSINQGAIEYYKNTVGTTNLEWQDFAYLCHEYDIPLNVPFKELNAAQRKILFEGSPKMHRYVLKSSSGISTIATISSKVSRSGSNGSIVKPPAISCANIMKNISGTPSVPHVPALGSIPGFGRPDRSVSTFTK
jgi:excinuclease ABC subunit A